MLWLLPAFFPLSVHPFHCLITFSEHGSESPLKVPLCPQDQRPASQKLSCRTQLTFSSLLLDACFPHLALNLGASTDAGPEDIVGGSQTLSAFGLHTARELSVGLKICLFRGPWLS